jgi:hypothetical protein
MTAQRMLASLVPPEAEAPGAELAAQASEAAAEGPSTDLVGSWRAKGGDSAIALTVDEESRFTWKATPAGKPTVELTGDLIASSDTIALETENQGTMVGRVQSSGPDKFTFRLQGMPPGEPGLEFERVQGN